MTVDLDELERLEKAATAGPWQERINTRESTTFRHAVRACEIQTLDHLLILTGPACEEPGTENQRLVCAVRNALPELIAEVRELRAKAAHAKALKSPRGWWALSAAISDLSEDHYCAQWMQDCEYDFWRMVAGGDRSYGLGEVSERDIDMLRELSFECGGWVCWSSEEPSGREFVPIGEWLVMFEKHELARAVESAAGGEGGK